MKLLMLGLVLTLFTPAAFSQTSRHVARAEKKLSGAIRDPVFRITGKLSFEGRVVRGSIRKSEIDSLLARRVELGGQDSDYGKYGIGYAYEDGTFPAFSCQEWALAQAQGRQGWVLGGGYGIAMDSFFIDTCSFLFALKDAKPAKRSFMAKPRVGLRNLNLLPVNVLQSFEDEGNEERDEATARGVRISDLVARGEIKVRSEAEAQGKSGPQPRTKSIVLDYDYDPDTKLYGSELILEEMGRADFDGDGIEDIFVSSALYANPGTMRSYDYFLLTRRSATAGFEVRELELPELKEKPEASFAEIKLKSNELKRAHITKQACRKDWPFTVNEGTLACARSGSVAVVFIAAGKTYALNLWARGAEIDGVTVSSNTADMLNANSMSRIFDKAFAMCGIK